MILQGKYHPIDFKRFKIYGFVPIRELKEGFIVLYYWLEHFTPAVTTARQTFRHHAWPICLGT